MIFIDIAATVLAAGWVVYIWRHRPNTHAARLQMFELELAELEAQQRRKTQ
jgi:hypothetical protein